MSASGGAQLERFKGELQLAAAQRSIRLTTVYEKTVDAASGTYEKLLAFHDAARRYTSVFETSDMGSKADRRKKMAEKYDQLTELYPPKKPFLLAATTEMIDGVLAKLTDTTITFMHGVEFNRSTDLAPSFEATKKWQECHELMTKEIPPALRQLENDLRKLLGIYSER